MFSSRDVAHFLPYRVQLVSSSKQKDVEAAVYLFGAVTSAVQWILYEDWFLSDINSVVFRE